MRGAEPQGRERTGDCWGREWGARRQGEHLERKQQVKPQGNKGQRMVMRGRRERTLGHWHSGGVGGHSEIEMLEDKVSSREATSKRAWMERPHRLLLVGKERGKERRKVCMLQHKSWLCFM